MSDTSETSNLIDKHVGKRLKKRREKLGLKQAELARQVDVSYQQIQKYERGDNKIPAGRLFQIAQALRVTTEYFYVNMNVNKSNTIRHSYINTKRTTPLNILLIEDDPTDQMITKNALEKSGIRTNLYVVHDGDKALELLRHKIPEDFPKPDIILLDLNIPKRDGFDVIRELNRDKKLCDIPVIILTNSGDPKHMYYSYENKVSGYISKSFDANIFNRNIATVVEYWSSVVILPSMQEA